MNLRCNDHPEKHRTRLPSTVMIFMYAKTVVENKSRSDFLIPDDTSTKCHHCQSYSEQMGKLENGNGVIAALMHQRIVALHLDTLC